ncbi:MAG: hypothetical protein IKG83_03675 [Prevotella sp.]|nr:hypothetical protein [Prevotella sp.]
MHNHLLSGGIHHNPHMGIGSVTVNIRHGMTHRATAQTKHDIAGLQHHVRRKDGALRRRRLRTADKRHATQHHHPDKKLT